MSALDAELLEEIGRLIQGERARGMLEAVLRLRALADMSERLSTDALIEMAATVCVTQEAVVDPASARNGRISRSPRRRAEASHPAAAERRS